MRASWSPCLRNNYSSVPILSWWMLQFPQGLAQLPPNGCQSLLIVHDLCFFLGAHIDSDRAAWTHVCITVWRRHSYCDSHYHKIERMIDFLECFHNRGLPFLYFRSLCHIFLLWGLSLSNSARIPMVIWVHSFIQIPSSIIILHEFVPAFSIMFHPIILNYFLSFHVKLVTPISLTVFIIAFLVRSHK